MIVLEVGGLLFPPSIWELELASVVFFFVVQILKINLGYDGNRAEHKISMIIFFGAVLFSTLFFVYYSYLTTYVLLIEICVGTVGVFFNALELILSFVAVIKF